MTWWGEDEVSTELSREVLIESTQTDWMAMGRNVKTVYVRAYLSS